MIENTVETSPNWNVFEPTCVTIQVFRYERTTTKGYFFQGGISHHLEDGSYVTMMLDMYDDNAPELVREVALAIADMFERINAKAHVIDGESEDLDCLEFIDLETLLSEDSSPDIVDAELVDDDGDVIEGFPEMVSTAVH